MNPANTKERKDGQTWSRLKQIVSTIYTGFSRIIISLEQIKHFIKMTVLQPSDNQFLRTVKLGADDYYFK